MQERLREGIVGRQRLGLHVQLSSRQGEREAGQLEGKGGETSAKEPIHSERESATQ